MALSKWNGILLFCCTLASCSGTSWILKTKSDAGSMSNSSVPAETASRTFQNGRILIKTYAARGEDMNGGLEIWQNWTPSFPTLKDRYTSSDEKYFDAIVVESDHVTKVLAVGVSSRYGAVLRVFDVDDEMALGKGELIPLTGYVAYKIEFSGSDGVQVESGTKGGLTEFAWMHGILKRRKFFADAHFPAQAQKIALVSSNSNNSGI